MTIETLKSYSKNEKKRKDYSKKPRIFAITMKNAILSVVFLILGLGVFAQGQDVFEQAENQCPSLPKGLLRAVSFTNTQCHHLTDADYFADPDDPQSMPRAYGMMGLVKDGKGCFRENLKTVAELSGISEEALLGDPLANVLAYAKACVKVASLLGVDSDRVEEYGPVIEYLSELPKDDPKDELPMRMMLYSVFRQLDVDLPAMFGEDYALLSGQAVSISKETDYPLAIWNPAAECNYEERTKEVSAVVIHYTEGSYAGCIAWFQNCDSEVSAHYVIRSFDGQVTQMVRECDKAWHAGSANGYTIGVEHEAYGDIISFFTEAMYASSADLIRDICSRYETIDGHRTFYFDTLDNGMALNTGLHDLGGEGACVRIRGHQHYPNQTHTDPGPYWNWNYYYKLINQADPVEYIDAVTVEEGTLNHLDYGDDERFIWVIRGMENSLIQLNFSNFDLETDYDFLWIYDGDDVYARKIGRWNTQSPDVVRSSGNAICVEFRSDCLTTAEGWQASWKVLHFGTELEEQEPETPSFYEVQVFDMTGRCLIHKRFGKVEEVDLNVLPRGTYLLRAVRSNDGKVEVKRIIR